MSMSPHEVFEAWAATPLPLTLLINLTRIADWVFIHFDMCLYKT
jgi:hypothetical protein